VFAALSRPGIKRDVTALIVLTGDQLGKTLE
jgi:hypothetical protein